MKMRKRAGSALLVVALLVSIVLFSVSIVPEKRTYVIGWEADPPEQVATKGGEPTGFAVELVREAARRRGIRLQWVNHPESSERALQSKSVDLWPLMTITEGRKKLFHLTDPYQGTEFGLLVDAKSTFTKTGDLKRHTISYYSLPFNSRLVRQHFTGSVYLPKSSLKEAVRSLCVGEAEAVFADHLSIFSLLLSDPPCAGASLRMLPNPACKIELGIGARREARSAADAIREEISVMAGDINRTHVVQRLSGLHRLQHRGSFRRHGFRLCGPQRRRLCDEAGPRPGGFLLHDGVIHAETVLAETSTRYAAPKSALESTSSHLSSPQSPRNPWR
jgi:ABC-type amino acid transport substrate-binding protein